MSNQLRRTHIEVFLRRLLSLSALSLWLTACAPQSDGIGGGTGGSAGTIGTGGTTGGASGGALGSGGAVGSGGTVGSGGSGSGGVGTGGRTGSGGAGTGGRTGGGSGGRSGTGGTGGAGTGGAGTGGAGTGGTGTGGAGVGGGTNCGPPITDFAASDGGFGSAPRQMVQIPNGQSVSIFRPSDANFGRNGCKHPLLVWGNGSTNTVDIWAGHLTRASRFGFVVVAPEQTQVNAGHMNAALDYVIALSQDSSSPYFNKVDTSKLGATGYSLGGAGAMSVASNARIRATFIWDSFGNCSSLHGPLGTIVASDGIGGLNLIDSCPPPAFGMEAAGTTHTSILGYPGGRTSYAQEGYVAWFRWHFMGDPAAEALFAGPSCGFCTRAGMTVRKKGID